MKTCMVTLAALMLYGLLSAQDYFPLTVGNQWTNKVINPTTGDSIGFYITTIIKDTTIADRHYYFQFNSGYVAGMGVIGDTAYFYSNGNDVMKCDIIGGGSGKKYQHSVTNGDSWIDGSKTFTYNTAGSITVPFGTFASCFVMNGGTYFAPDVGIIKTVFSAEMAIVLTNYVPGISSIKQAGFYGGNSGLNFSVVANPVNRSVNILCSSTSLKNGVLSIYNVAGKMIKQYRGLNQLNMTVDVSELSTGTYYLKLQVNNNVVLRKATIMR